MPYPLALLSTAVSLFAIPSRNGPGQPDTECGAEGLGDCPHGLNTQGLEHATTTFAGSDGTPSLEHAQSSLAVSQYDMPAFNSLDNQYKSRMELAPLIN